MSLRACAAALLLAACAASACRAKEGAATLAVSAGASAEDAAAPLEDSGAQDDAAESAAAAFAEAPPEEPAFSACNAPSVSFLHAFDDSRTLDALEDCAPDGGGFTTDGGGGYGWRIAVEQPVVDRCGHPEQSRDPDLPRILDSALPLDSKTVTHVRALFATGKARGRRPDVFALVGDSITIDYNFMRPFSWTVGSKVALDPRVRDALRIDDGRRSVIDFFRGALPPDAGDSSGSSFNDSFWSVRAAKIGARATWVTTPDSKSTPLDNVIAQLSPAYAIVMFGTNDAEFYLKAPSEVAKLFGESLRKIVDDLEGAGTIPILTTIPKHMHDKRFPDCSRDRGAISNARFMIQTNAVSAEVAAIACERHIPLIDFRYAIDPLLNHGVAGDGVHPSVYQPIGGGILDAAGLQCGFNVRNAVTLRMLKVLYDTVTSRRSAHP